MSWDQALNRATAGKGKDSTVAKWGGYLGDQAYRVRLPMVLWVLCCLCRAVLCYAVLDSTVAG